MLRSRRYCEAGDVRISFVTSFGMSSTPSTSRRLLIAALLALAAFVGSCTKSEWRELEVSEGGFSVLMRGQPHYARHDIDTPAGKMIAHLYSSERPQSYYAVGYSDYPLGLILGANPEQVFAGVRNTWVRRIGGKLTGPVSPLTLAGRYPGVEFNAQGKLKGADALLQARLFLVDQRLYQVIAMVRKNEVPQGEINRFLNSFRLVQASEVNTMQIRPEAK
jgi:hypothetical protein